MDDDRDGGNDYADYADHSVQDELNAVVSFAIDLLQFLIILLVGWLIAKVLRLAVAAVLRRAGFDRLVERSPVGPALARSGYDASSVAAAFIYYAALLVTLRITFAAFGPNPMSDLLGRLVGVLPDIAVAIIIAVVAVGIAVSVRRFVARAAAGLPYGQTLATVAYGVIVTIGIIAALSQVGIATAVTGPILVMVLVAVAGILIVGVGGGLIGPMRRRWEQILDRAERDAPTVRTEPPPAAPAHPTHPAGPTGPMHPAGPADPTHAAGPTGPADPAGPTGATRRTPDAG